MHNLTRLLIFLIATTTESDYINSHGQSLRKGVGSKRENVSYKKAHFPVKQHFKIYKKYD